LCRNFYGAWVRFVFFVSEEGTLRLKFRMDKVNVRAIINDPDVVPFPRLILSRVTTSDQMQDPGVKESQQ